MIPAMIFTLLLLVDLIANMVILGFRKIWKDRKTLYFEIFI